MHSSAFCFIPTIPFLGSFDELSEVTGLAEQYISLLLFPGGLFELASGLGCLTITEMSNR